MFFVQPIFHFSIHFAELKLTKVAKIRHRHTTQINYESLFFRIERKTQISCSYLKKYAYVCVLGWIFRQFFLLTAATIRTQMCVKWPNAIQNRSHRSECASFEHRMSFVKRVSWWCFLLLLLLRFSSSLLFSFASICCRCKTIAHMVRMQHTHTKKTYIS